MTQTATITPRETSEADLYGDEVLVDGATFSSPCLIQQRQRDENNPTAGQSETWALFLPPDTPMAGVDAVTVDGKSYELVGPPWGAYNPRLRRATHIEADVRRAT